MEKRYYNAESLEQALGNLESQFGLTSASFYEKVLAGEQVDGMPRFHRSVWASLYRDYCRMHERDFASSVGRALQFA
jgi:hypothetical protein